MSEKDKQGSSNQQSPYDRKALQKVLNYAVAKNGDVDKVALNFKEKGAIGLFWDSKIPENEKSFFNWFSFSSSDKDEVLKEIKTYQEFYKKLKDVLDKVRNSDEQAFNGEENPCNLILDMQEKLSKMAKDAKLGKDATSSSAMYYLHESFIQQHKKLKSMITRAQNDVLKEGIKEASEGWKKSIDELKSLKDEHKALMHEHKNLMKQNKELLEFIKNMNEEKEKMQQENANIRLQLEEKQGEEKDSDKES